MENCIYLQGETWKTILTNHKVSFQVANWNAHIEVRSPIFGRLFVRLDKGATNVRLKFKSVLSFERNKNSSQQ